MRGSGSLKRVLSKLQQGLKSFQAWQTVESPSKLTHVFVAKGFNSLESVGWRPPFCTMWALHGLLAYPHDMAAGFPRAMIHLTETETQRERGTGVAGHRSKLQCLLGYRLRIIDFMLFSGSESLKLPHTQGEGKLNATEWKIKECVDIVSNHHNQLRVLIASYRNPTSKWNKHQWEFICSPNEKTLQVDKLCESFVQSSGSISLILFVLNHPQAGFLPEKYDCRNSRPHVCA